MKTKFLTLRSFTLLLVMALSIGSAWGKTWTITYNVFETSYSSSDGEHEIDGITFTSSNVSQNSSKIQFKSNSGYLYNNTPMPGNITKITLATTTNLTIKVGTSANPSSGTTVTSGESISGSYKYFYIKGGGSTPKTATITVEYYVPKHHVYWYANGSLFATTEEEEGEYITLPSTNPSAPSACSAKKFFGWTEESYYSHATNPPTMVTNPVMGTEDIVYYAVFATRTLNTSASTAVKIYKSDLVANLPVLIVDEYNKDAIGNERYTDTYNNYYLKPISLTISNGIISSINSKAKYTVTLSGDYFQFKQSSNYLNMASSYDDLSCNTTSDKWTLETYQDGYSFKSYNNSNHHYIYPYTSGFIGDTDKYPFSFYTPGTVSDFTTSCVACTEPTVLTDAGACQTNTDYDLKDNCFESENTSAIVFTCTSDNKTYCTIDGSTFNASAAGTYTIKATQVADGTYCAVDESFNVVVSAAPKTVNFNGNSHGTPASSSLTEASAGAGVTLPTVNNIDEGWEFIGWSTYSSPTSADAGEAGDNFVPSSNGQTLYAYYKQYHTVTLLNNNTPVNAGGFDAQGKKRYYHGETLGTLPTIDSSEACDKTSKVFMGWTSDTGFTKRETAPSYVNSSTEVNADMTLRAVWARAQ